MLLTLSALEEIKAGRVDLVFRRWQRPTVKTGGRLRTAVGELSIVAVEIIDPADIDDTHARRAGYDSADALRTELFRERPTTGRGARARTARPNEDSPVYRVSVAFAGEDRRAALRSVAPSDEDIAAITARLDAMDRRSARGPWTARTLRLIETWPGRRAPDLAEMEGRETLVFKTDVRRLKELGLTESLRIGYRLSPRGEAVLRATWAEETRG